MKIFSGLLSLFESAKFWFCLVSFTCGFAALMTGHIDGAAFVSLVQFLGLGFLGAHTVQNAISDIVGVFNAAKPPPPDPK